MRIRLSCAALLALLSGHALAFDTTKAPRYPSPDLYRPNVDRIILNGPGSTGDVSGMSVTLPSRTVAPTLAGVLGLTAQVEWFRLPADGPDWGPALQRAQASLAATGGTLRVATPGRLTIATQVTFPKDGAPQIALRCDSLATVFTVGAGLTKAMFKAGGATDVGGMPLTVEGCSFAGDGAGTAWELQNANTMTFRHLQFSNLTTGINTRAGFALTLDDIVAVNVQTLFASFTPAHNFVGRRVKAYGGNNVFLFAGGPSDNVSITEGDFESNGMPLQMTGGSALRFVGNYVEYTANEPVYSTATLNNPDISHNAISLGKSAWSVKNLKGGQFKGNFCYRQTITWDPGTVDVEVADNTVAGAAEGPYLAGFIAPTPYQVPALLNGWTQQQNYSPVGFRRGRDGRVYLRGNLVNGSAALGTAAFTLPYAYRPASQRVFLAAGTSGLTTVTINGDGNVYITATGGAGTSGNPYQAGLDGISFEPGT